MDRKRKSFWSKWSSLFSRSTPSTKTMSESWQQVEQETEMPQTMVYAQPQDMERWGQDEPSDGNSQMLNIPIEPGRQVSTIILSPTKNGFKAVIAHYGINTSLAQALPKDMSAVSAQFENRRTLTLVFDMNSTKFDDVAVGLPDVKSRAQFFAHRKSESTLGEPMQSEAAKKKKSMSASAIFVRTGTDEIVESAAFLQAQLSIENASPAPPPMISDEKSVATDRRHMSCRNFQKSRVAFKTISEPLWQDKQKLQKEMVMKQNIQDVLNQFIFLDRDDSLMNYPRLREEIVSEKDSEQSINNNDPLAMELLRVDDIGTEAGHASYASKMSFSFDRLSEFSPSAARNVAPDLLVNIKPFKEYITNYPKLDFLTEGPVSRSEKIGVMTKRPPSMFGATVKKSTTAESVSKARELIKETDLKSERPLNKSRLSLCIKCGVRKAKGDEMKLPKGHASHVSRNFYRRRDGDGENDPTCKKENLLKVVEEKEACTLCSAWKSYNKTSFTSVNLTSDSIEDILKELEGYDHNSIFKRNISQFKTKIKTRSTPLDFKSSQSSLSFAEVIELEEGKLTCLKNSKTSEITSDFPNVTLRLIEFVRKTGDKTVQLQRIKTSVGKLEVENVMMPNAESCIMENSCLLFTYPASYHTIKVMAQRIEESLSKNFANIGDTIIPQETIQVMFPAYANFLPTPDVTRHYSENKLEEFRGSYSKRTGQIPDLICHLWMDKVDDLRNELIVRMNETRMCYDPSSYHSTNLIRLQGRRKATSRCSVATATSPALSINGGTATPDVIGNTSSRSLEKSEKSEDRETEEQHSSTYRITEEPSTVTQVIYGKSIDQQERSTELHSEDLQPAGPNEQIISFTNTDFKIHSCLTFFVPFVHQIQTAVEILNSAIYSFPVRKVEDQIGLHSTTDYIRILRSYTLLKNKKKYFIDNDLESLILKKCIEKNVVSGMSTSTTSKKEITTIKGSESGNHLLVTNKKILTKNDRIKKSEILTGAIQHENNEKTEGEKSNYIKKSEMLTGAIEQGSSEKVTQMERIKVVSPLEDSEDPNGVQCLYYKKTDGNETVKSSEASNYSDGKVCESDSSVIVVSDLDEDIHRSDQPRGSNTEGFNNEHPPMEDEILNPNIVNDSLQETDRGTPRQLSKSLIKSHSVNLLQKIARETPGEGDMTGGPGSDSIGEGEKCEKKTSLKEVKSPPSESQIETVKVTEEKLIINDGNKSKVLVHEKVKASGDKIIKKTGEGVMAQKLIAKKAGGKIVICRGDNCPPSERPSQSKRMSVVVTLSRHTPEKKPTLKYEPRTRGLIKTVEAKHPDPNANVLPKEQSETPKSKPPAPNRSNEGSYCVIQRKR